MSERNIEILRFYDTVCGTVDSFLNNDKDDLRDEYKLFGHYFYHKRCDTRLKFVKKSDKVKAHFTHTWLRRECKEGPYDYMTGDIVVEYRDCKCLLSDDDSEEIESNIQAKIYEKNNLYDLQNNLIKSNAGNDDQVWLIIGEILRNLQKINS